MTERLETVLDEASSIANPVNSSLIQEFYQFMVERIVFFQLQKII